MDSIDDTQSFGLFVVDRGTMCIVDKEKSCVGLHVSARPLNIDYGWSTNSKGCRGGNQRP
jgi:hypothetical protein